MKNALIIACVVVGMIGAVWLWAGWPGRWSRLASRREAPIRAEVVSSEYGEQAALTARAEVIGRHRELCAVNDQGRPSDEAFARFDPPAGVDPAAVIASLRRDAQPVWSDEIRDRVRAGLTPDGHTSVETRYDRLDAAGWTPGTDGTGLPEDAASAAVEPDLDGLDPLADPLILFPPVRAALFDTGLYSLVNEGHSGETGSWRWDELRAAADIECARQSARVTPAMVSGRIRRRPAMVPAGVMWHIPRETESDDLASIVRHQLRFGEVTS